MAEALSVAEAAFDCAINECRVVLEQLDLSAYGINVAAGNTVESCNHYTKGPGGRWRDVRRVHWSTCLLGLHPRQAEKGVEFWLKAERHDCLATLPCESAYLNSGTSFGTVVELTNLLRPTGIEDSDLCIDLLMQIQRYRTTAEARMKAVLFVVEAILDCRARRELVEADPYWRLLRHRITSRFPDPRQEVVDLVTHYHYIVKTPMIEMAFFTII
jgi:hypothetical protein